MRTLPIALTLAAGLLAASSAFADRVQVYSIQGDDCGRAEAEIAPHLKKVKGVKKWVFDNRKFELAMTLDDKAKEDEILKAIQKSGCYRGVRGAGLGSKPAVYKQEAYPAKADYALVTDKGSAVGPLEKLRVPGKYTVLDFYADWCGPCKGIDKKLREIVAKRDDVAVRKLNVVDFETPLAKELGRKLRGLPYIVVFAPDGKKTEIVGGSEKKLSAVLGWRG